MDEPAPEAPALQTPRQVVVPSGKRNRLAELQAALEHAKAIRGRMEAEGFFGRKPTPAETWLRGELRRAGGKAQAADMVARAREAGFTPKQLRTARENLDVLSVRLTYVGGWTWLLPDLDGPSDVGQQVPSSERDRQQGCPTGTNPEAAHEEDDGGRISTP